VIWWMSLVESLLKGSFDRNLKDERTGKADVLSDEAAFIIRFWTWTHCPALRYC